MKKKGAPIIRKLAIIKHNKKNQYNSDVFGQKDSERGEDGDDETINKTRKEIKTLVTFLSNKELYTTSRGQKT